MFVQRTIGHDWYEMTSKVAEAPVTQNALLDTNFKQKDDASKLALLNAQAAQQNHVYARMIQPRHRINAAKSCKQTLTRQRIYEHTLKLLHMGIGTAFTCHSAVAASTF